jgi:Domain of unknown function (DUF4838)
MLRYTVLVLVLSVSVCAAAEQVQLVHDGMPAMTVVVQAEADPLVRQAAEDLCHYVQVMSGVELPMQFDGKRVPGKAVYIGKCEAFDGALFPPADTNPETYAVSVHDGNLFLTGNHPPAVAFATVSFIEDDLGVRWYAPGDLWEYVPGGKQGELALDVKDRVVVPDWSPRIWSGHAWVASWQTWNLRNKALCVPPVPFRNMQNHLHTIFAPEKYAESHPEYYPLISGERWIPEKGYRNWRPCTSNPDVVRLTVEAAREYLDAHPEHNSFSLAMDDIYRLCGCDNCRAMDAHPDDYEKKQFSDRHYKFVNMVARELAKTHPDKCIGTLCYHIARELPETVPKLEPNVFISMTQRVGEWWRPGRRESDMSLTDAWRERCEHMSRYGYMGLGFLTPRVFPHAMAEGMKFDHARGFEGVYNECYVILPNAAPMMWMMAKLQWDTDQDADALLDEFYDRMFGSAAASMKQYYAVLEDSYMAARPERLALAGWGHRSLKTHSLALSAADVGRAEQLVEQAATETDDPKALARIDVVAGGLEFAGYIIRAGAWALELNDESIETREQALAVLARVDELVKLSEAREKSWAEAMKRDDILGESLRGLRGKKYFATNQIGSVEGPAAAAMNTALEVLDEASPDAAREAVERLAEGRDGTFAEKARMWLLVSRGELTNMLKNPGFEQAGVNTAKAEQDWDTAGAPPEWSSWHNGSREGVRFFQVTGKGRDGSTAAAVENAESGCYLQSIPVKPGERYVCAVHARAQSADGLVGAGLSVRWQNAAGKWHDRRDLEPEMSVAVSGKRWHRLSLVATVPEGAGNLVLMLRASGQDDGAAVLYDDAVVSLLDGE